MTPPTVGGNDNAATETKIFFGGNNEAWCKGIKNGKDAVPAAPPAAAVDAVPARLLTWSDYKSGDNWVCSDAAKCGNLDDVKTLAGLLPKITVEKKEYEHQCVKYAAKTGAKQKHSDPEVACQRFWCPHPLVS